MRIKDRLYRESGGANPKRHPNNEYGKERINRSQDQVKESNENRLDHLIKFLFVMVAINRSIVAGIDLG